MNINKSGFLNLSFLFSITFGFFLLFIFISISISQIFLALSLLLWIGIQITEKRKIEFPMFFWFLIAYVIISLISSIKSVNTSVSLIDSKDLLLFLIVPIVYSGFNEIKTIQWVNRVLLISFLISATYSFFYILFKASSGERITGFMGHWMTQAGLLLLFCSVALSLFLFKNKKWKYSWGACFLLALPLIVMTLTRNAWIGLFFAVITILLLYKPKTLLVIPVIGILIFFASPKAVKQRATSIFNLKNSTNKQRFEYWEAGIKIIKKYPLLGTGPNTVEMEFQNPKYGLSKESKSNVHLHNNFLQIAAERGLFALLVWIGFLVSLFLSLLRYLKEKDTLIYPYAVGATAALFGLISAGLFEYNFGDSEVVALFLFIISVPFALRQVKKSSG